MKAQKFLENNENVDKRDLGAMLSFCATITAQAKANKQLTTTQEFWNKIQNFSKKYEELAA